MQQCILNFVLLSEVFIMCVFLITGFEESGIYRVNYTIPTTRFCSTPLLFSYESLVTADLLMTCFSK